jgi:prepilin-type N-terminal cleavage/methylation domain-containing protein
MTGRSAHSRDALRVAAARGFTLLELLVAVAVFLIVSSTAFTLFQSQQQNLTQQEGLSALNINVRNALTQIQMDAVNSANGLSLGAYAPAWPVGVEIKNQTPSTACSTGAPNYQFGSSCFDTVKFILADRNTPTCNLAANFDSATSTTVNVVPSSGTAAQYYSNFLAGDELLVVSGAGFPFTTITLTQNATYSGSNIVLKFTSTSAPTTTPADPGGINPSDSPCPPAGSGLCLTTDALSTYRGVNFYQSSPTTDWVIRLAPITYTVDTSNANDPKLTRQVWGATTATEVMDQLVSFKVGAALVNDPTGNYYYNASAALDANGKYTNGGFGNDFTLVRSVRVTILARTTPNGTNSYRNPFDGGPYQVLGASVVVNPRNMSMRDQ